MAKIMTKSMNLSGVNNNNHHGFGCNNNNNKSLDDWSSPVMIKMQSFSRFGSNLKTLRSSTDSGFFGRRVDLRLDGRWGCTQVAASGGFDVKMSISIGKSSRWWEKGVQPNMKEITGAEDLVESLNNAGDQLVVVDFFSPGCGGCKALHPKLCQLAEMNPDVQFLQVNYEEHKSMCYSLHVHVLPFFRFYRGAEGRLCSFSCTNATIKKFKDALAKHKPERCSLGPAKGLEEKDLVALGANQDLSFVYNPKPEYPQPSSPVPALNSSSESSLPLPVPLKQTLEINEDNKDKTLVSSGR